MTNSRLSALNTLLSSGEPRCRLEAGDLHGVMSTLVFAELLVPLYRAGDRATASGLSRQLSALQNLEISDVTTEISVEAARLRAEYGIRTLDAIHAATAMVSGASGMLTNDKQMRALGHTELSIWFFDDLLQQGA